MAEVKGLPGFTSYGTPDTPAGPPQTQFPKSQGGEGASPPATKTEVPGLPGFTSYGGSASKPAAPESQNSFLYDVFHPQAADLTRPQTWRDWATKTYDPSASDVGKAALDDASFGTADYLQSKITGENVANIRARTADAQAAMGPAGPLINALTYAIPGGGEAKLAITPGKYIGKAAQLLTPKIGRYGAAAAEGAAASGASSAGHQAGGDFDYMKFGKDVAAGAAGGIGGQAVGDAVAAAVRNVSNYVRGSPGRGGEAWNWRTRAAADDPTLPASVADQQTFRAPDDPAQPGLAKLQSALAQSTEPGAGAGFVQGATGAAATGLGLNEGLNWAEAIVPGGVGAATTKYLGDPLARGINRIDKNINTGQALDQLYPALYGPQSQPALDTSDWANAIRQWQIGANRPPGVNQP